MNKSVFITVRTSSSRLKNKALLEIKGKSTIEHLIDRMLYGYSGGMIPGIDNIVLCTTTKVEDDVLCELAVKKGKKPQSNYSQRLAALRSVIEKNFPKHPYEISKLENDFGPAVVKGSVQALVVSEKTSNKGSILNELRRKEKLPPVEIVQVSMVLAEDGKAISTTRIKNSEIDSDGNLN